MKREMTRGCSGPPNTSGLFEIKVEVDGLASNNSYTLFYIRIYKEHEAECYHFIVRRASRRLPFQYIVGENKRNSWCERCSVRIYR